MTRTFILCLGFLAATIAAAAEPVVTVTSFSYAGSRTTAAELCGKVTGLTAPSVVKISVDQNSKHPGTYYSMVGLDGNFCVAVLTNTGLADVSLGWTPAASVVSARIR